MTFHENQREKIPSFLIGIIALSMRHFEYFVDHVLEWTAAHPCITAQHMRHFEYFVDHVFPGSGSGRWLAPGLLVLECHGGV